MAGIICQPYHQRLQLCADGGALDEVRQELRSVLRQLRRRVVAPQVEIERV